MRDASRVRRGWRAVGRCRRIHDVVRLDHMRASRWAQWVGTFVWINSRRDVWPTGFDERRRCKLYVLERAMTDEFFEFLTATQRNLPGATVFARTRGAA